MQLGMQSGMLSFRKAAIGLALLFLAAAPLRPAAPAQAADQKVVNVFNWSDYIDPKVLEDFTRETGIKVVYDTFDSNEMLETRLLAGQTGYDVVVPSATFLQRLIGAGVFRPLDRSKLPHAAGLSPEIMARLAAYDPGNRYAVDYMWFTTGIAYDRKKVAARLGSQPLDTWDIVFKPELLRQLADCGVYVLDSPEDIVSIALAYLKLDPNSRNEADIRKAFALLSSVRKSIRKFHSSEYINALANGDICLAVAWAGDSFQAADRAREANNGVEIAYVVPRQGTLMSFDTLAIPKDAPHAEEAYAFIDFLMRPEIAARNTLVTHFANPVPASSPLLPKEVIDNPAVYPDKAMMARLFTVAPRDQAQQKIVTREWTRLKTGR
jgi:putrescine transport system substrate-binding protein